MVYFSSWCHFGYILWLWGSPDILHYFGTEVMISWKARRCSAIFCKVTWQSWQVFRYILQSSQFFFTSFSLFCTSIPFEKRNYSYRKDVLLPSHPVSIFFFILDHCFRREQKAILIELSPLKAHKFPLNYQIWLSVAENTRRNTGSWICNIRYCPALRHETTVN